MTSTFRSWRRSRRYRALVRNLAALNPRELGALGIQPGDIQRLARKASCA